MQLSRKVSLEFLETTGTNLVFIFGLLKQILIMLKQHYVQLPKTMSTFSLHNVLERPGRGYNIEAS